MQRSKGVSCQLNLSPPPPPPLPALQYEGEIHVTIIATGFSQTFEENLWGGKSSTVRTAGVGRGGYGAGSGAAGDGSSTGWGASSTVPPAQAPPVLRELQEQQQRLGQQADGAGAANGVPLPSKPNRRSWW